MRRFTYQGRRYDLFDHPYNTTIENERAVEIPIARRWLRGQRQHGGLEVGNVMAHYGSPRRRRIVDLYERAPRVENIDVMDVQGSYPWVLAISTLEHVRWDDEPVDPYGAVAALDYLWGLLEPGGRMLVTVPTGHHPILDGYLADGAGATRFCTMRREGPTWVQTTELEFLPYSMTTKAAAVWIGEWDCPPTTPPTSGPTGTGGSLSSPGGIAAITSGTGASGASPLPSR